jgi:hypothetical protein
LACGHSEPAPTVDRPARNDSPSQRKTDAAVAEALAILAETKQRKVSYTDAGAALMEGLLNDDPRLIGMALTELARGLTQALPEVKPDLRPESLTGQ